MLEHHMTATETRKLLCLPKRLVTPRSLSSIILNEVTSSKRYSKIYTYY